jgi:hypothetical protein
MTKDNRFREIAKPSLRWNVQSSIIAGSRSRRNQPSADAVFGIFLPAASAQPIHIVPPTGHLLVRDSLMRGCSPLVNGFPNLDAEAS